ncbi:MAG: lysoplasmalogenase [Deltaproteobacteria bacterium]|nr:lysoplasmalogenase [Deltaproteobacteria bacterium]
MTITLILSAAVLLLAGLLVADKRESTRGLLSTKPFLSALFIVTALSGPRSDPGYFAWILGGLILCMAGDIFLIFFDRKGPFLAGLVSFLAGHVLYAVAFFSLAGPGRGSWVVIAPLLLVSVAVFAWLRPHLGKMLVPVLAYVAVITAMVIGAATLFDTETVRFPGRALAFSGALLFYASDIFVARQRFLARTFFNRAVGLPLYFIGQFMIAFSIRLV